MVAFNEKLARAVIVDRRFGRSGAPWEFNLRDVLRWCQLAERASEASGEESAAIADAVAAMFPVVYLHRFRTAEDRAAAAELFIQHFPDASPPWPLVQPQLRLSRSAVFVGSARLQRSVAQSSDCGVDLSLLRCQMPVLEASAAALEQGWMLALVGQSAAGKSSVARMLAGMAGAKLHEVRSPSPPFTDTRGGRRRRNNLFHSALSERRTRVAEEQRKIFTLTRSCAALCGCEPSDSAS